MNQIIVMGCIKNINTNNKEFTISIPRSYPTYNGDYLNDVVLCKHINSINKNMTSYICINDSILIKGRLETDNGAYYIAVESYQVLQRKV